jgi:hypothetical protein
MLTARGYAWPYTQVGHELIAAGMLIMGWRWQRHALDQDELRALDRDWLADTTRWRQHRSMRHSRRRRTLQRHRRFKPPHLRNMAGPGKSPTVPRNRCSMARSARSGSRLGARLVRPHSHTERRCLLPPPSVAQVWRCCQTSSGPREGPARDHQCGHTRMQIGRMRSGGGRTCRHEKAKISWASSFPSKVTRSPALDAVVS